MYLTVYKVFGYKTAVADTVITHNVPGQNGRRLVLRTASIFCDATAQLVDFMYAGGAGGTGSRNTASALAVSGQKVIACTNAPVSPNNDAAANLDNIAYQLTDGTWEFNTVASISGSDITLTNNIAGVDAGAGATAIAALARVMIIGIAADNNKQTIGLTASTTYDVNDEIIVYHPHMNEPMFVYNPNATTATAFNRLVFGYYKR